MEQTTAKIYYTMGELAEMFDVNLSLIRHWEGQFDVIKPKRNKKGNRLFTQEDVDNFKLIYHLVKERGMTLGGAKRAMKMGGVIKGSSLERDAQVIERLEALRAMLLEIRTLLEEDELQSEEAVISKAKRVEREPDATPQELFAFYEQRLF